MKYDKIRKGDVVKLARDMETKGGTLLAAGTLMKVVNKRNGLDLQTLNEKPCEHCGIGERKWIRGVWGTDVVEVPKEEI